MELVHVDDGLLLQWLLLNGRSLQRLFGQHHLLLSDRRFFFHCLKLCLVWRWAFCLILFLALGFFFNKRQEFLLSGGFSRATAFAFAAPGSPLASWSLRLFELYDLVHIDLYSGFFCLAS